MQQLHPHGNLLHRGEIRVVGIPDFLPRVISKVSLGEEGMGAVLGHLLRLCFPIPWDILRKLQPPIHNRLGRRPTSRWTDAGLRKTGRGGGSYRYSS